MYMENSYPWHWIISNKNKKMFDVWNNIDPISKEECIRYKTIKSIQLNENFILKTKCSDF
jgi:deoxyribonuclease-1